jgi:predicted MFS family arabinose efflux permease
VTEASLTTEEAPFFSRSYSRYVLSVLFVVSIVNFIDRQILSILIQPIKEELDVSDSAMGFLTGFAFALFYTFAGIPIARWSDRGSRRTVIALGLTVWSGMTAISGLARSFTHLALARIGVGIGEATASPASHSIISDMYPPERRASAIAVYTAGAYIGMTAGLMAGGWLYEFFGWRVAFFVVGLPGIALALLVRFTVQDPVRGQADRILVDAGRISTRETIWYIWKLVSFRQLSLGMALNALAFYALIAWAPTFLIRVHGMSTGEAGTWFGLIIGIAGGVGLVGGGALCDVLQTRDVRWNVWLPAIGGVLTIPPTAVFLLWPEPLTALVFCIPVILLGAIGTGPILAMAQGLVKPRMRATASAVHLFLINLIGLGLGPQVAGILSDLYTPRFGDHALAYALLIVSAANVWAVWHYMRAARTLADDLRNAVR